MSLSTSRVIHRLATRSMFSKNSTLFSLEMLWKQLRHTRSLHRESLIRCDIRPNWRQRHPPSSTILLVHVIQRMLQLPSTTNYKTYHVARYYKITQHDTTQRDTAHDTQSLMFPGYHLHPLLPSLCTPGVGVLLLEHLVAEFQCKDGIMSTMQDDIPNHFPLLHKNLSA